MLLREPKFQQHRGYWIEGLPENSLQSLSAARKRGALMAEFDVRLTKDYVPVLYHDADLFRLHKARVKLKDLTWDQLLTFAPDVTSLEDILKSDQVPEQLNIELKTEAVLDPSLEIQVTKMIKKYRAEERVVFSSFNPFSLIRALGFAPDIARALLVTEADEKKNYWFLKQMSLLPLCQAQFLHWDQEMITAEKVKKFTDLGYQIAAYTVNDADRAQELFDWGVTSIITDKLSEPKKRKGPN